MKLKNYIIIDGYRGSFSSPQQGSCPTITDSNKETEKDIKKKAFKTFKSKKRNSIITNINCRTASKLAGYSTDKK
jgi:hypothetical protein